MHLCELSLQTGRLATLRSFYATTLGLPLLHEDHRAFSVRAGATHLTFDAAPVGMQPYYHFAFNIPENQLEEAKEWLSPRVVLLTDASGDTTFFFYGWDAHACYFTDPAGNIVELIARHNLSSSSSQPFGPESLLCVSEIGLPVRDHPAFVAAISIDLGLPVWKGDREHFTALGDEEGLLIVVTEGYGWQPAGVPAHPFPVEARISGPPVTFTYPGLPYRIHSGG